MKILHIDNSPAVTGAYKALLSWCLQHPEWEHVWVLPNGSAIAEEVSKHYKVYQLPFVEIGKSPAKILGYLPALWQNGKRFKAILNTENPDLVHANDLYNLLPYTARNIKGRKLPLVVHARMLQQSFPTPIYRFWKKWHLNRADGIVAVSQAIKRDWDNSEKVTVIYDPITITENLPPYSFTYTEGEPFRFLYLANYIAGKGQDDALQSIKILRDRGVIGFKVDFYGGTTGLAKNEAYKKTLETYVLENGLSDIVTFHGPVQDVEAVMKKYHALLHFSRAESFGMVCYEALYYGMPVISSDCGGPAEMMVNGKTGYLLPLHDIEAYADAMQNFIALPGIAQEFSEQAKAYVIKHVSNDKALLANFFEHTLKCAGK